MTGSGRRRPRRPRRDRDALVQLPWRQVVNPYPPMALLDDSAVERIHQASLRILSEIGVDFLLPEACELLRQAGAIVSGSRVRFDPGLIGQLLATAPAEFTLHARNPEHNVHFGGNHIVFASVASAPNVSDLDGGRRSGNFHDFRELVKLAQSLNIVHLLAGYPVEPTDLPPQTRHLDAIEVFIECTDKAFHGYSLGRQRILDALHMTRIGRGIDEARMLREPSLFTVVNTSSPLRIDAPMLEGIIEMSRRNQIVVLTPFTLAGAMAPATLAGALALQNAEALAGMSFTQVVQPGSPVIYGGFTSNVDMKSGAPAFGTPEYARAAIIGGQLARRYGVPYRSSNANAANCIDAQAAYESQMSLWPAILGHGNLILHAAGWMEGGLCASFEKMVLDADLLQMMAEFLQPVVVDEDTLGFEAIADVGPGGHFFGTAHTLARFESAFYSPLISDWRNFETWSEAGGPTAPTKAARIVEQLLREYQRPPLDPAIAEQLRAFVAQRKEQGGVQS